MLATWKGAAAAALKGVLAATLLLFCSTLFFAQSGTSSLRGVISDGLATTVLPVTSAALAWSVSLAAMGMSRSMIPP